ncbi:hypothetical protein PVAND_013867 [Polypedilum vanderplanki]|uniref:Uncharacterized protein n=1 Tax=Polypedilum vanderplanki TaxID=319348 RepID=A0A9J6CR06_POLVA|nr:hypothetical protein PVAND_013867 [Polypedilum vanderplanki]
MLFGPSSSPFTSQLVKNKVAKEWMDKYPEAADTIINFMYMDDALMSTDSLVKAKDIAFGCIEILKSINWDLIGFQMLGSVWDPQNDCFSFHYDNDFVKASLANGHIPTKRDQASTIARMFDVRGDVAHYIIRGRILLQRSWRKGLDWDDPISAEDFDLWVNWLQDIYALSTLKIPRRYSTLINSLSQADRIELHVFADADKNNLKPTYIFLLRELLMIFEKSATITGIKMTYDVKSKRTLSYFFINFLFRKQLEDFDQVKIPFNDKLLQCELCHQVQLLMVASDLHFLQKGTWNEPHFDARTLTFSVSFCCLETPHAEHTEKQKRKPMKRRQPVEVEERPLPAYPKPGKAKILSVEILPRFDFEAETPADCEDDNVVQINLGEAVQLISQNQSNAIKMAGPVHNLN